MRDQQPVAEDTLGQDIQDCEGDDLGVDADSVREGGCREDAVKISQFRLHPEYMKQRERRHTSDTAQKQPAQTRQWIRRTSSSANPSRWLPSVH